MKAYSQDNKLRYCGIKDLENSNKLREDMLLYGAVDQYLYETSKLSLTDSDDIGKVHGSYSLANTFLKNFSLSTVSG
jgi:hypothetical protein